MIKKLSIALLVLCSLCFVGCNVKDTVKDDCFEITHDFNNFSEYKTFYENFCEYNQERFIMPQDTESLEIVYGFDGVAHIKDLNTDESIIDYSTAYMQFSIKDSTEQSGNDNIDEFLFVFQSYNIAKGYDYVCNNLAQIRYEVDAPFDSKFVSIYVGNIKVADTVYNVLIDNEDEFELLMDKIIAAYKGGL